MGAAVKPAGCHRTSLSLLYIAAWDSLFPGCLEDFLQRIFFVLILTNLFSSATAVVIAMKPILWEKSSQFIKYNTEQGKVQYSGLCGLLS